MTQHIRFIASLLGLRHIFTSAFATVKTSYMRVTLCEIGLYLKEVRVSYKIPGKKNPEFIRGDELPWYLTNMY
jgi:hypothetical protein